MTIPKEKLDTWSKQGPIKSSKETYKLIRNLITDRYDEDRTIDIFLQGSYKNSTNIYGRSDVDIVIKLSSIFRRDISSLSKKEKKQYYKKYNKATYRLEKFRKNLIDILKEKYENSVEKGNKAIKIKSRLPMGADIVICQEYRKYKSYIPGSEKYIEGIYFEAKDGTGIKNYPKQHWENGVEKNKEADKNFRETVRIFKNAKDYHDEDLGDLAPSYFIEGLLYNVPSRLFRQERQIRVKEILDWLDGQDFSRFT